MTIVSMLKSRALLVYRSLQRWHRYRKYSRRFRDYMRQRGIVNRSADGEEAYLRKWHQLSRRVEPYSYRLYSHYMGPDADIIPEDIGRSWIEEALNPPAYRMAYSDKNLLPLIVGKENVPKTIVCRINGGCLLDGNYELVSGGLQPILDSGQELILKPTIGSSSGRGVLKFQRRGEQYICDSAETPILLSREFLMSYGNDFVLQAAVRQHPFMSRLNDTSVNTIRLSVYRSVKDENVHVTASTLRIGRKGACVDNANAGGRFVGVDISTGRLGAETLDLYGKRIPVWNDIDFAHANLTIPCWDDIIIFSRLIGNKILHHRFFSIDVALTESGRPLLIEYNINAFGYRVIQYTGQKVFGEFTDEVITYCAQRENLVS